MTKSPWSADYPDRWLPNDGTGDFEYKPDPRWREHKPGDPEPCPTSMHVQVLSRLDGRDRIWVVYCDPVWDSVYPNPVWDDIVAWRPAEPGVWYVERGDVGDVSLPHLRDAIAGDIKALVRLAWDQLPQGYDHWLSRAEGSLPLTDDDLAFLRAVEAAHAAETQEPAKPETPSPALSRQIGGDHYSKLAIQPIKYIEANRLGFSAGCVVKYVTRWRDKGGVADLEKAVHFLQMMIERAKGKA
jgi:hypothetical protein